MTTRFALSALLALWVSGCDGIAYGDISKPGAVPEVSGTGGGSAGTGGGSSAVVDGGAFVEPMPVNAPPSLQKLADKYFPSDDATVAPARIFRLTRRQLDSTAKMLLPAHVAATLQVAMPRDPLQTNYEYDKNLAFNAANFTPYADWLSKVVTSVKANPSSVIDCAAGGNTQACLDAAAKKFITRAFRNATTPAEVAKYSSFFLSSVTAVGAAEATGDLVDVTLSSPSYLFRDEVHTDANATLLPAQRLQGLTYTLTDLPPEALAFANPAESYVSTSAQVESTVDQVLKTPAAREKLMRFFTTWLEVKEPTEFTISPLVYPDFTEVAAAVVDETQKFLNTQLSKAAPTLKDVTQSKQSFVSASLAKIYEGTESDPTKRLGIFTLPAVLASHSGPTTTRLVKRGVFFTRKVMCLELGAPPPDAPTTVPEIPNQTERQRIEAVTTPAKCAGCHTFINPFGAMQESYDATGKWRTTDQGLPIDPAITVNFLDEGPLTAKSSVEALTAFTNSARFKQCFVRQLFRYYVGREELPADAPLLRQMFLQFANEDRQDLVGLLRMLGGSARLAQRKETP